MYDGSWEVSLGRGKSERHGQATRVENEEKLIISRACQLSRPTPPPISYHRQHMEPIHRSLSKALGDTLW
jgi:hypothetical protein